MNDRWIAASSASSAASSRPLGPLIRPFPFSIPAAASLPSLSPEGDQYDGSSQPSTAEKKIYK